MGTSNSRNKECPNGEHRTRPRRYSAYARSNSMSLRVPRSERTSSNCHEGKITAAKRTPQHVTQQRIATLVRTFWPNLIQVYECDASALDDVSIFSICVGDCVREAQWSGSESQVKGESQAYQQPHVIDGHRRKRDLTRSRRNTSHNVSHQRTLCKRLQNFCVLLLFNEASNLCPDGLGAFVLARADHIQFGREHSTNSQPSSPGRVHSCSTLQRHE